MLTAALLLGAPWAGARAVTVPVCKQGEKVSQQVADQHGWPKGTLELLNHPLRHSAWRHIFNTEPADRINVVFLPRSNKDLKTIVRKFAKIAGEDGVVMLDPRPCQRHSFVIPIKEELNVAAVLNLGSAKVLANWYANLPRDAQGNRIHNNAPLAAPPQFRGPTLTIFAGNKAIDLDTLKFPTSLIVTPAVSPQHRADHRDDPVVLAIDRCVGRHARRGGKIIEKHRKLPKGTPGGTTPNPPAAKATK